MSATYWPSEKSAKYHFYIVDPVSVEETPNFTLRQFKVSDMMSSCPSLIKLFQLRKWPDRGKPQSYKAILDLIGQVHIARNNDETKGPVVVHCGSGSGRTGVFCALSIVVERMRAAGVVDLLQTVRQLREQRHQMVETLEEYAFCYEAALQYLSSFDHITA
ncbi:tyrosine- phosphatase 13-like [Paramuricea clavata]|uniref:Tyrosine- phosphatase 13-like, partial n=1 Tax=Paramuricea clavata TaxID=317549 RepID=A0A6S7L6P9_PARCT|nr:tyrosine- phosphatase 13-like [Paramuricea clavata]